MIIIDEFWITLISSTYLINITLRIWEYFLGVDWSVAVSHIL